MEADANLTTSRPRVDSIVDYLAKSSDPNLFDAMIARQLAFEMLSESKELDLSSRLQVLASSGHRAILERSISAAKASGGVNLSTIKLHVDDELKNIHKKPVKL